MIYYLAASLLGALLAMLYLTLAAHYRRYCRLRLTALDKVAQSDTVAGIGVSILCPSPHDIDVVVNLLGTLYPKSEVVVALNRYQRVNLLSQMILRYSLLPTEAQGVTIYRSAHLHYRRLVVVVSEQSDTIALTNLAARHSLHSVLLAVPSTCHLWSGAVAYIVEQIARRDIDIVDVVTTADRDVVAMSRSYWLRSAGFPLPKKCATAPCSLHIDLPLVQSCIVGSDCNEIIECAEYNFCDFLALNIMRSAKKLLSLIKP